MSLCWEQLVAAMDEVVSHLVHFWGQRGEEVLALRFSVRRCDAVFCPVSIRSQSSIHFGL